MDRFVVFFSFFIFSLTAFAQKSFTIYYDQNIHDKSVNDMLNRKISVRNYRLITQHYIDPQNKGIVDLELLKRSIISSYPSGNSKEVICLDLENSLFNDLIKYPSNNRKFKIAEAAFISMINCVKKIRPNLTVGIYSLPQRFYYGNPAGNDRKKFDNILKICDVIFPSLYILYPDQQIGKAANSGYLKKNLDLALEYGRRLNKPVIPFIWGMIHVSNKKYAYKLVSVDEMKSYIALIRNYKKNGESASGVVVWETKESIFENWYSKYYGDKPAIKLQDKLLKDYLL